MSKDKDAGAVEHKAFVAEIKAADDGTFTGYGAVFGNVDGGGDIIRQGAFADSLAAWKAKGKLPRMFWQHDPRHPIGVWMSMSEDAHGLLVQGRFTKGVQAADEAYALLRDGAVDGLSIGFRSIIDEYDSELNVRKLIKLDLMEVSLVSIPMNDAARVTAVKAAERIKTIRDFEAFLRDEGGFSNAAAKSIAAGGFKAYAPDPRDEDGLGDLVASTFKGLAQFIRT